jgi:hypothetical protein
MKHALWLMLIIAAVTGAGAGLIAAGLIEVAEWWIAAAHRQLIDSGDGRYRAEYNPGRSGSGGALVGWGTALFVGGVTFGWLLCRFSWPVAGEAHREAPLVVPNPPSTSISRA